MQHLANLTIILLLLTVAAVACDSWRQDPLKPLRLDGEVVNVKMDRDKQSQIFHLQVRLTFANTGDKPVILLLGSYGEKRIGGFSTQPFHALLQMLWRENHSL